MQRLFRSVVVAAVLAACGGRGPVSPAPVAAPPQRPLVAISLRHRSHTEEATRDQLEGLLARYDLRGWLFTDQIVIDDLAIPHSHPVLTLHSRHLGHDDALLSTFLHEELHHFESARPEAVARATAELEKAFPALPVGFPEGAGSKESSYLHLIVNFLEYESLVRVIGQKRADETFALWENDHYRAIYRRVRESGPTIAAIVAREGLVPPFLARTTPSPARFDLPALDPDPLPRAASGEVDEVVLDEILRGAEATRSSSLLVIHDGKLVAERSFGGPRDRLVQTMSVTKSFAAIAIELLLEDGKVQSVDVPIGKYVPAFSSGKKGKVTLRHVLQHTSGIEHGASANALDRSPDRVAYVSTLPVTTEPGATFSYNNEASALLTAVVAKAAREPLDTFLQKRLFAPLGIDRFEWEKDGAGAPCSYYGLSLSARDLAKVGALLGARGAYHEKVVIPAPRVAELLAPARPDLAFLGRLVWIERDGPYLVQTAAALAAFAPPGFPIEKLAPLDGRSFGSRAAYWAEAGALLHPAERAALVTRVRDDRSPVVTTEATTIGFRLDGWLGQLLLVYPEKKLVVVRQHAYQKGDEKDDTVGFAALPRLAPRLVR